MNGSRGRGKVYGSNFHFGTLTVGTSSKRGTIELAPMLRLKTFEHLSLGKKPGQHLTI